MTTDHTAIVYRALCELRRATEAELDAEVNEGCQWSKEVPRTNVKAACRELEASGAIERDGKAWRLRLVEETGERLLF